MTVNTLSDLSLSQNEYVYLVEKTRYDSSTLKITVPKMMQSVNNGTEVFNRNIFVNDSSCKPTVQNTLKVQNYITVKKSDQCSLEDRVINKKTNLNLPSGLGLVCSCINNNYKNLKVIDYM